MGVEYNYLNVLHGKCTGVCVFVFCLFVCFVVCLFVFVCCLFYGSFGCTVCFITDYFTTDACHERYYEDEELLG